MRKNLPYYLIGAWFVLDAILAVGRRFAPASLGGTFLQRAGIVLGGVLLSTAILIGLVSAIVGVSRRSNAAAVVAALILYCIYTGFYLFAATTTAELGAPLRPAFTIDRLSVLALGGPVSRGRELYLRANLRGSRPKRAQPANGAGRGGGAAIAPWSGDGLSICCARESILPGWRLSGRGDPPRGTQEVA
jgi:hypothetical protein